jgi:hypothetical protein
VGHAVCIGDDKGATGWTIGVLGFDSRQSSVKLK